MCHAGLQHCGIAYVKQMDCRERDFACTSELILLLENTQIQNYKTMALYLTPLKFVCFDRENSDHQMGNKDSKLSRLKVNADHRGNEITELL